ncbi:hypothetical protein P8452_68267 [Trifolium repens]|nr:hypothetical protein P8452_68267 [Trifolium repens]
MSLNLQRWTSIAYRNKVRKERLALKEKERLEADIDRAVATDMGAEDRAVERKTEEEEEEEEEEEWEIR